MTDRNADEDHLEDMTDLSALYEQVSALNEQVRDLYTAIKAGLSDREFIEKRGAFIRDAEKATRSFYLIVEDVKVIKRALQDVIGLCDSFSIAEWLYRDETIEYWEYEIPSRTGIRWAAEALSRKMIGREDAES